ncbi:MAG TPA: energy transducer TonB, partial [Chitinophagaceae bacterium]
IGVVEITTKLKTWNPQDITTADTSKPDNSARQGLDQDENKIFEKEEVEPTFTGGPTAWRKFLETNLRTEVASENGAPAGSYVVWLQFVVDKEGNISDLKALTSLGYGMEKECLRIMKLSPPWLPGLQNGHKIKAYKKQAITFMIENN